MSHWHALAKLRMHNDITLNVMDAVTISLGDELRHFSHVTSAAFETRELGREYSARMRRKARGVANRSSGTASLAAPSSSSHATQSIVNAIIEPGSASAPVRKQVKFNMNTYKTHSFPDYVMTIRRFGTTDSYSTEPVSLPNSFMKHAFHYI